jgi:hypothetical protein
MPLAGKPQGVSPVIHLWNEMDYWPRTLSDHACFVAQGLPPHTRVLRDKARAYEEQLEDVALVAEQVRAGGRPSWTGEGHAGGSPSWTEEGRAGGSRYWTAGEGPNVGAAHGAAGVGARLAGRLAHLAVRLMGLQVYVAREQSAGRLATGLPAQSLQRMVTEARECLRNLDGVASGAAEPWVAEAFHLYEFGLSGAREHLELLRARLGETQAVRECERRAASCDALQQRVRSLWQSLRSALGAPATLRLPGALRLPAEVQECHRAVAHELADWRTYLGRLPARTELDQRLVAHMVRDTGYYLRRLRELAAPPL